MFKLYLDPGHGGSDPGAADNGLREKDLTLAISLKIREILANEYADVAVKMSRTGDTYPSLPQRTNEANAWGANFFLSVHINSGGGTGFETFTYPGTTKAYQNAIHDEIMKVIGLTDRGKKQQDLHVLRESHMSAVLTESGFIDNINDSIKMKDTTWINAIARAHVVGLEKAFNLNRKVTDKQTPVVSSLGQATSNDKEEDIMSQKFEPSAQAIRDSVSKVLLRFESKEPALAASWRDKANSGELTISDAIGLLYVAVDRGYISGK